MFADAEEPRMLADTVRRAAREKIAPLAASIGEGDARRGALFGGMAKTFASDTAMRVTTDSVQVLGGYGYMKDHGVERMMRDAKLTQIYTGTNQITRLVTGRSLLLS
jgi:alkylation response protein AidB-like acyl-CoA dehydrogenase